MLAVTAGEPAGIGPDLIAIAAQAAKPVEWVAVCDAAMLRRRADELGLKLRVEEFQGTAPCEPGVVAVLHVPLTQSVQCGQLNVANVPGVMAALDLAIEGALQGQFSGLVTAPMQKSVVNDAGFGFSGHTEYLAEKCGADEVVMLLVADTLRVALATTHLPLRAVADAINQPALQRRLGILNAALKQQFGIAQPRILVAGLNPHAGEQGHLGREEIDVIAPVCQALQAAGLHIQGPLPADTLFTPRWLQQADAVMAMYHDQGLPVLKYAGFGEAVNVTLGLPIVRTSVDHGTALDLAGTGRIDTGSLHSAISLAAQLVKPPTAQASS